MNQYKRTKQVFQKMLLKIILRPRNFLDNFMINKKLSAQTLALQNSYKVRNQRKTDPWVSKKIKETHRSTKDDNKIIFFRTQVNYNSLVPRKNSTSLSKKSQNKQKKQARYNQTPFNFHQKGQKLKIVNRQNRSSLKNDLPNELQKTKKQWLQIKQLQTFKSCKSSQQSSLRCSKKAQIDGHTGDRKNTKLSISAIKRHAILQRKKLNKINLAIVTKDLKSALKIDYSINRHKQKEQDQNIYIQRIHYRNNTSQSFYVKEKSNQNKNQLSKSNHSLIISRHKQRLIRSQQLKPKLDDILCLTKLDVKQKQKVRPKTAPKRIKFKKRPQSHYRTQSKLQGWENTIDPSQKLFSNDIYTLK